MNRFNILTVIMVIIAGILFADTSSARVTGRCDNCHTMHNSQNAGNMNLGKAGDVGSVGSACLNCHSSTRPGLTRMDCLGCHAVNSEGVSNIDSLTGAPQVVHAATDLAAGNFKYVFYGDDAKGHNVHGFGSGAAINNPDIRFLDQVEFTKVIPPGYLRAYDPSDDGYDVNGGVSDRGLMCAGANGCHGDRNEESVTLAMKGTHHADDSALKFGTLSESGQGEAGGSTVGEETGKSYRFLRNVLGGEDSDWQSTKSSTDHNEYKGQPFVERSNQQWTDVKTTSRFCAECHGNFHITDTQGIGGGTTGVSPWLRHPTDVVLGSGEVSGYDTYDPVTPVGRQDLSTVSAGALAAVGSNDIVMCLSCHRPHASEFNSIMRWEYNDVTSGTGCITCHTNK